MLSEVGLPIVEKVVLSEVGLPIVEKVELSEVGLPIVEIGRGLTSTNSVVQLARNKKGPLRKRAFVPIVSYFISVFPAKPLEGSPTA